MNYYIQGNAANADKIKAAFEKLGYSTSLHTFFDEDTVFITLNGNICECNYGGAINELIKTHPDYKELELPVEPKFKVGDWYLCTKDFLGKGVRFDKGKTYHCGKDDCLQQFDKGAHIAIVPQLYNHFKLWTIADAKDGDVLVSGTDNPFIYDGNIEFSSAGAYVGVSRDGRIRLDFFPSKAWTSIKDVKPSTKEQRDLLFAKLREAGYTWDEKKKELCKIQHYDISNFHVGMPVLVREYDTCHWQWVQYSHFNGVGLFFAAGKTWRQCIPYAGNEHLLGTTDMCDEQYINW